MAPSLSREWALRTRVVSGDDPLAREEAASTLRAGGLVAFPTDTVYGLAASLHSPEAIGRLYAVKERPLHLAIPVLLSAPGRVSQVAERVPGEFEALAARFWPGALTIVVWRDGHLPGILTGGLATVGVRMPDHPLALGIIEACGGALAVSSANISGRPAADTAEGVLAELGGRIELVVDGGRAPKGVASSIVDLTVDPPRLLREGALPFDALAEILPRLQPSS